MLCGYEEAGKIISKFRMRHSNYSKFTFASAFRAFIISVPSVAKVPFTKKACSSILKEEVMLLKMNTAYHIYANLYILLLFFVRIKLTTEQQISI
jgi:hypothetical protein